MEGEKRKCNVAAKRGNEVGNETVEGKGDVSRGGATEDPVEENSEKEDNLTERKNRSQYIENGKAI